MNSFARSIITVSIFVGACSVHSQMVPVITSGPASQVVTNGGTAVFNVAVSGTGPFAYQWLLNGTNLPIIISTAAGDGTAGFAGDSGLATSAKLNQPNGVVVDTAGNLFVVDNVNSRIRKVTTNGAISTSVISRSDRACANWQKSIDTNWDQQEKPRA
jgi:NHL repeat